MQLLEAHGVDNDEKLDKVAAAIAGHAGVDDISAKIAELQAARAAATEPFDADINALVQQKRELLKKFGIAS